MKKTNTPAIHSTIILEGLIILFPFSKSNFNDVSNIRIAGHPPSGRCPTSMIAAIDPVTEIIIVKSEDLKEREGRN